MRGVRIGETGGIGETGANAGPTGWQELLSALMGGGRSASFAPADGDPPESPAPRGEWDHRKLYVGGDIVTAGGGHFVSLLGNNRACNPIVSPSHWARLADDDQRPLAIPFAHKARSASPAIASAERRGLTVLARPGAAAPAVGRGPAASDAKCARGSDAAAMGRSPAASAAKRSKGADAAAPATGSSWDASETECAKGAPAMGKSASNLGEAVQLPAEEAGQATDDETRQCAVCLTHRACTTLLWCGHSNLCVACARSIVLKGNKLCPTCGRAIARVVRTY